MVLRVLKIWAGTPVVWFPGLERPGLAICCKRWFERAVLILRKEFLSRNLVKRSWTLESIQETPKGIASEKTLCWLHFENWWYKDIPFQVNSEQRPIELGLVIGECQIYMINNSFHALGYFNHCLQSFTNVTPKRNLKRLHSCTYNIFLQTT